jgi:hypothetical protein
MKGSIGRSRSMRGAESPQRERDPTSLGPRQKSAAVVEPSRRRGRSNAENVAPVENVTFISSSFIRFPPMFIFNYCTDNCGSCKKHVVLIIPSLLLLMQLSQDSALL